MLVLLSTVVLMQAGLALGQISFGATLTVLNGRVSVLRGDGSAVHRVETLQNPNSSYKIIAGGSVIEVGGTTVGTSVDGQGNVTAFLQEGKATFNGYALHPREACTLDTNRAFECADQKGATSGRFSPRGSSTASRRRTPISRIPRSRTTRRTSPSRSRRPRWTPNVDFGSAEGRTPPTGISRLTVAGGGPMPALAGHAVRRRRGAD